AVSPVWRTVLWTASLGFMGTLCLLNASRCGRVHCRFTGPFFILGAVASLGYGLGFLPFGSSGWKWICAVTVIGGIALTCIPQLILGRYGRKGPDAPYLAGAATRWSGANRRPGATTPKISIVSRSILSLAKDCSGGNSRLSYLSGVGGGQFFDPREFP